MSIVYIGLGANIGNREANLRMALRGLTRMSRVQAVSSLYETDPIGSVRDQPAFYNAACRIDTGLEPESLLRFLKTLEYEIGRRPGGPAGGPRPIDLDVLLYDDRVIDTEDLTIPHPRLAERAFVLVPLTEIAPELRLRAHSSYGQTFRSVRQPSDSENAARLPVAGETIANLAASVGETGVRRIKDAGWDGVAGSEARVRL